MDFCSCRLRIAPLGTGQLGGGGIAHRCMGFCHRRNSGAGFRLHRRGRALDVPGEANGLLPWCKGFFCLGTLHGAVLGRGQAACGIGRWDQHQRILLQLGSRIRWQAIAIAQGGAIDP
ncbi:MAG TPA: hypothetical protein VGL95_09495 [Acetobacteraceae bacterium]